MLGGLCNYTNLLQWQKYESKGKKKVGGNSISFSKNVIF